MNRQNVTRLSLTLLPPSRMTFTCADIEEISWNASVVYIAIGCARSACQQYPALLHSEQNVTCFWIDPTLEEPPLGSVALSSNTTWIPIREEWSWLSHKPMLMRICSQILKNKRLLIVQDFTGADIRSHYPTQLSRDVLNHIVFDVNDTEGDCFPNMDAARLYRDPTTGSLQQPAYMTLVAMQAAGIPIEQHLHSRKELCRFWAWKVYRQLAGHEEYRDWCRPEIAGCRLHPLFRAYGSFEFTLTAAELGAVLRAAAHDIAAITHEPVADPDSADFSEQLRQKVATTR